MAELNVQPKAGRPWWLWLLLALAAAAAIFFLMRGCDRDDHATDVDDHTDTLSTTSTTTTTETTTTTDSDWNSIDRNVPVAAYDEVNDRDIEVRGNDNYTIYSLKESILFATNKSEIQPAAAKKLEQVANSIGKRYTDGQVRIYGYTDAQGNADYNKELSEKRAMAVQNWLTEKGKVGKDRITLHPVGEAQADGSDASAGGKQSERRVDIIVRKS